MPRYERLSAQDSTFLYAESPVAHMHVGSLVIFEDSGFTEEAFLAHIGSRLHLVPRFRKKLAFVPGEQGRPVWVDDPHFDLRFHVRWTGLPRPGNMEQAKRLMGRVMSIPLDRSRPLWELWMFDLPDGRKGLVQKTHHCLIDGLSGIDLGTVLLDLEPNPAPQTEPPPAWKPEMPPSGFELFVDAWAERLSHPGALLNVVQQALSGEEKKAPAEGRPSKDVTKGILSFGKILTERAPETSLNVPIGAHRRFEIVRADLEHIKALKNKHACKVNDVVLSVVAGGLREILRERGDPVDTLTLRALVPVSVRDPSQRMTWGNRVSAMVVELPVREADPVVRLQWVRDHVAGKKESQQAVGAEFWLKVGEYTPPTVLAMASRAVAFQRMVNVTVTNVPGPQFPLFLLGGQMLEAFPFVPLVGTMAVGVAILSYMGQLCFGVTGDWDAVPDLERFAAGIENSLRALADASPA